MVAPVFEFPEHSLRVYIDTRQYIENFLSEVLDAKGMVRKPWYGRENWPNF